MHLKKGCCPSNIQPHPSRNYVQPAAPKCATRNAQCAASDAQTPIKQPVHEIGLITLHVVSGKATSLLWNEYMARYHYLGYAAMSGSQFATTYLQAINWWPASVFAHAPGSLRIGRNSSVGARRSDYKTSSW